MQLKIPFSGYCTLWFVRYRIDYIIFVRFTYTLERLKNIHETDFFKTVDLHVHSNYSDGTESFENLVTQAYAIGLKHFSITDHNTVEGYKNFDYKNCEILIPGVEFDCILGHVLLHIIGYGIDPENEQLQSICAKNKKQTSKDITRLFYSRHPKKVIEAIHSAGGVAVFAHPCCSWTLSLEKFIKKLTTYGLDGVEVYYPYEHLRAVVKFHSRSKALEITEKLGLLKTGGSDCHKKLLEEK